MTQKTGEIHQRTYLSKLWVSKLCFMAVAGSSRLRHVRANSPLGMGELPELAQNPCERALEWVLTQKAEFPRTPT